MFDLPRSIQRIDITWKYPPAKFEIQFIRGEGLWESIKEVDATDMEYSFEFPMTSVSGV